MDVHTVLVPAFNGQSFIADALDSALGQTGVGIRLVVSDDCSSDGTHGILERYRSDPRVEIHLQRKNLGLFRNWNFLLGKAATGTFTLISQDDRFASPDAVAVGLAAMGDGHDAVFCDLAYIDGSGAVIGRRSLRNVGASALTIARRSLISARNCFGIPLVVRTSALRGLAFDEELPYVADLDFAISVGKGGLVHIERPLLHYRVHGGNATLKVQANLFGELAKVAEKHAIDLAPWELAVQRILGYASLAGRMGVMKMPPLRRLLLGLGR